MSEDHEDRINPEETPPTWEVVVGHWGKLLTLRYAYEKDATHAYDCISNAMEKASDYRNDVPKVIHLQDMMGHHAIAVSETKSVSVVEIAYAVRINRAYERAIKGSEAPKAVEGEAAEVQGAEPEA